MDEATELLPLNPREFLILFSLVEEERHGYGIVKHVESESGGAVHIDPANLYRTMKRLLRDGLVEEADERIAADADNERRRYYALTGLGREVVTLEAARLARVTDTARERDLIPDPEPRT